ncbi:Glycosyltransferase family 15 protein [Mycena indigotica]|uniref:Glycosyltransferase family 15 protein n=1 Tax=Mycena indigotica TaxID=2126181 RepID=A0A8H6S2R7_9AGAR|nr:Glycosyltransferase family 15 protein [Mycena indigotica]KAF7291165.1 Glycosyltransferase family 15 protein [Mycena indigotica]
MLGLRPRKTIISVLLLTGLISVYLYFDDAIPSPPFGTFDTSNGQLTRNITFSQPPYHAGVPQKYYNTANSTRRASAAIVVLCQNHHIPSILASMALFEEKFNVKYGYPYVFLNDVEFTDEFKANITAATHSRVEFGLVPREHWVQPSWIDEERAAKARKKLAAGHVLYGDSVSCIGTCVASNLGSSSAIPYYSSTNGIGGKSTSLYPFSLTHWNRIEPDVKFFCDIDFDPFLFMEGEDKKYAFTISMPENRKTVRTLWPIVKEFIANNPSLLADDNSLDMLTATTKGGAYWNMCHFWSNFEIADLDLWRSDEYLKFFNFLDSKGGFYYERWGDAPVHTFGAAMFVRKDQIHFFNEIGYWHIPYTHCPSGAAHSRGRCTCEEKDSMDRHGWSCLRHYDALFNASQSP